LPFDWLYLPPPSGERSSRVFIAKALRLFNQPTAAFDGFARKLMMICITRFGDAVATSPVALLDQSAIVCQLHSFISTNGFPAAAPEGKRHMAQVSSTTHLPL
jgi:hypothetical protein